MSLLHQIILVAVIVLLIFCKPILNFIFACLKIGKTIPADAVNAKVVHKGFLKNEGGARWFTGLMVLDTLVTFEFEDCRNVTLYVPQKKYDALSVGSTGKLAYYGNKFERFVVE